MGAGQYRGDINIIKRCKYLPYIYSSSIPFTDGFFDTELNTIIIVYQERLPNN